MGICQKKVLQLTLFSVMLNMYINDYGRMSMKKKLLIIYVFVAFILLCTNVYATINMDLTLTADNTSVQPGETVVVTVNLKNMSSSISSIEGYINIDENVLESISSSMVVATDGKIKVTTADGTVTNTLSYVFNPTSIDADYDVIFNTKKENIENNDCFFVMDLKNDISTTSNILTLQFTVKDSASIATVSDAIRIDNLVACSADESDKTDSISESLDIKVVKASTGDSNDGDDDDIDNNTSTDDDTNTNENTNTNTNNNTNSNTNNTNTNTNASTNTNNNTNSNTNNTNTNSNTNSNSTTNTNTDGTVSATNLPSAGAKFIILPVIIFAILAYISYNKYIKYKDI